MASAVNFRMHHGSESSCVNFVGNGIKVLELKREILERKKFSGSSDFDLKIVDESGKVFDVDDEYIPKNSSLVVRRMPAKSAATSLIAKLKGNARGGPTAATHHIKTDIVMPVKAEAEPVMASVVASEAVALASSEMLTEEENDALNQISQRATGQAVGNRTWVSDASSVAGGSQGGGGLTGVPRRWPATGTAASSGNHGAGYVCRRCGKAGHFLPNCPTNGDPSYDKQPPQKLMNTSTGSRKIVATLEGIETKNKTVNQLSDGRWEIFESSQSGLMRLTRESESSATLNIDMKDVPEYLKCPLSNTFLKEAVSLPCCKQCVNDSIVRQQLLAGGLKCPLCGAANISTDALMTRTDIRNSVDSYIRDKTKKAAAIAAADSASATAAASIPAFTPPTPLKAPPLPTLPVPVPVLAPALQLMVAAPMRPPPPPGGPPPPAVLAPALVAFAPPPPQPIERPVLMVAPGMPTVAPDFHQSGMVASGLPAHLLSGMGMPSAGFFPPGLLTPGPMNMSMLMQSQAQTQGPDVWAMQQAQPQGHMGNLNLPAMQHLGPIGQHQQGMPGMPSIPEGWIWSPNGPIPPRDFFVPPMSRDEFMREQNAQLEEARRRDERRQAMVRDRNEQRGTQSSRVVSSGSSRGGRGWSDQNQRSRDDQSYSSRLDESRSERDKGDRVHRSKQEDEHRPARKGDKEREGEKDSRRRNRSSERVAKTDTKAADESDSRRGSRKSRSKSAEKQDEKDKDPTIESRGNSGTANVGDRDTRKGESKTRSSDQKEKDKDRFKGRPRDVERERRDKLKQLEAEKNLERERERDKERDREREKDKEREKEREKEKEKEREKERDRQREKEKDRIREKEREREKLEKEKGERLERERERDRLDRERVRERTRELERERKVNEEREMFEHRNGGSGRGNDYSKSSRGGKGDSREQGPSGFKTSRGADPTSTFDKNRLKDVGFDKGSMSRPNDDAVRMAAPLPERKRGRSDAQPEPQDTRDRNRDKEKEKEKDREEKTSKRSKTSDFKTSRSKGEEKGVRSDDPEQLKARQVVYEDERDRKSRDKGQSNSDKGLSSKSGRNAGRVHSNPQSADPAPLRADQGGFYTSSFKSRSIVADSDDKNKRKKHDDDRWEMRKN